MSLQVRVCLFRPIPKDPLLRFNADLVIDMLVTVYRASAKELEPIWNDSTLITNSCFTIPIPNMEQSQTNALFGFNAHNDNKKFRKIF